MIANPFFNRGPIRESRFFFVRPRETQEVLRLISGSQNCSLVGPIKSGKTSLLLHLARPETYACHDVPARRFSPVYISFEGLGKLTPEQFFHYVVRETARQSSGKIAVVWASVQGRSELSFLEFKDLLDQLEIAGERLVFLLDEIELAVRNPSFDLNFFSALRHVAARPEVCFVTATDCHLHEMEVAGREIGSPFADLFSVVRVRGVDSELAWRSISSLASEADVDLEPERDFILGLAGGWPYHLQVVAYEVFERKLESGEFAEEQQVFVARRAYEQVEPVLSIMWERLGDDAREAALSACDGSQLGVEVEGFTCAIDGRLVPTNGLVGRFLEKRLRDRGARVEDFLQSENPDRSVLYGVVRVLMRAVEARDQYARYHAEQVARYSSVIAREMGCPDEMAEGARIASRVHDIGRVSISDMILLKPGPLTELETEIMRTHPVVGAQILDALEFPWAVKPAVRYHHERLDGSGYPEGLMGEEIPLLARIVAVADVIAAMTSDRPYRSAFSREEALSELKENAGVKYDDRAVSALEQAVRKGII